MFRKLLTHGLAVRTAGVALVSAAVLVAVPLSASAEVETHAATARRIAAADALSEKAVRVDHLAARLDGRITSAKKTLDESEGHVLSNETRVALAAEIDAALARVTALRDAADGAKSRAVEVAADDATASRSDRLGARADRTSAALGEAEQQALIDDAPLAARVSAVTAAVGAWNAEQERVLRQAESRAAAEAALRAAAAQRTAATTAGHAAPRRGAAPVTPAGGPRHFTVYVRTAVAAGDGMQAAVNAGGQVAIRYSFGTIVAAHNRSDATALALRAGDTVTLSGAVSGTYTVGGAISAASGSNAAAVRSLGTPLMMQTCFWGSDTARVVGLY